MFYYLNGTVAHIEPYLAVIDCGGVGYACRTTGSSIGRLQVGQEAKLYTYLHVAEGVFDLYGFATEAELEAFKLLIGVSGVGPKAGLAVLSVVSPEGLSSAVFTGDEKAFTAAPGIGKKIAQRIILELKDKVGPTVSENFAVPMPVAAVSQNTTDATAALLTLGYNQQDIARAMKNMDVANMTTEDIIKLCLKSM